MTDERLAILAEGLFGDFHAKTAHGVISLRSTRGGRGSGLAARGPDRQRAVPFCLRPVPIVAPRPSGTARAAC
jgi:hypothetical protein